MDENAKGGKIFSRVIQSARINNEPIGPEHHLHNKQFKKWCEGKSAEEILAAIESPKRKKKKELVKKISSKESKAFVGKIVAAKVTPVTKTKEMIKAEMEQRAKEKLKKMEQQKLIDSLTPFCRCDHIKSSGSGL